MEWFLVALIVLASPFIVIGFVALSALLPFVKPTERSDSDG